MKKQRNVREGVGDEKSSHNTKNNDKATSDTRVVEKSQDDKRKQRIVLKSTSKTATRITLKGKAKEEGTTKTSPRAKTQRSPGGATGSTRSPHATLRSRAGNSSHGDRGSVPDFSSYSARELPITTIHPNKLAALDHGTASIPRSYLHPRSRRYAAMSRQEIAEADKHITTNREIPATLSHEVDHSTPLPSQHPDLRENDEAQFEHLSEPSRVTGSESFLVKVDCGSSYENEAYDWELVGYERPVTPTPISITPAKAPIKIQSAAVRPRQKRKQPSDFLEGGLALATVEAASKCKTASKATSVGKSGEIQEHTQVGEEVGQDFDSKIRSILTQSNRSKNRRANKSQDSVKSVKWDPSIISVGPVTSSASNGIEVKQTEASSDKKSLKESLRAFTDTVKDLKKSDRRVLAELLEALRNVESDDESNETSGSSEAMVEKTTNPGAHPNTLQPTLTAEQGIINQDARWNEMISKAVAPKDQKSYRDALATGLIQSAAVSQQKSRERSKSTSTEHTLIGSDDASIKVKTAAGLREVKKLNPLAPVFRGFIGTKQRTTQSDPVEDVQPFISSTRKAHQSCEDDFAPQAEVHVAAKVEKYVPPALRGERNTSAADRKLQEPIWVKVRPDPSPKKLAVPKQDFLEDLPNTKPVEEYGEEPAGQNVEQAELDKQNQIEWFSQWLYDAAKPDHGSGIDHTAELQHLLQNTQACKASYEQAIEDISLSTQVHGHDIGAFGNYPPRPLPYMNWPQFNPNLVQQPNMGNGYPLWPLPMLGPLIPIPPPPYLFGHLQQPSPSELPQPLIPLSAAESQTAPKKRLSSEEKPGRIAHSLDPAWRDQILNKFASKFPMTGKCQTSFPIPPIQDLETKPAQIQQKLELLILQQKEKKAFEERFKGKSVKTPNGRMPSFSSVSENLIRFE